MTAPPSFHRAVYFAVCLLAFSLVNIELSNHKSHSSVPSCLTSVKLFTILAYFPQASTFPRSLSFDPPPAPPPILFVLYTGCWRTPLEGTGHDLGPFSPVKDDVLILLSLVCQGLGYFLFCEFCKLEFRMSEHHTSVIGWVSYTPSHEPPVAGEYRSVCCCSTARASTSRWILFSWVGGIWN